MFQFSRGYSTRWICGMWWFFALIMCSSYTANLAAFLTKTAMEVTIKDVEELAGQTKVKYGTLEKGSTYSFFKVMIHFYHYNVVSAHIP